MRVAWLFALAVAAATALVVPRQAARAQFQSTQPTLFFCYALNPSEGVVYVSDVHLVGPFEERASYPERYASWLRASGRLGEGRAHCLMRATMREVDRDRRDLPVTGCFECVGPQVYRDVKWPFGDAPFDSVRIASIEPPRSAMSSAEEAALDKREAPETRPGTTIFGRLDLTDAVKRVGVDNPEAEKRALASEKGGKWYPVVTDDRCPGWGAVAFASSPTYRRYFVGHGATETEAIADATARAEAYIGARELWKSGAITTYFNDTVEVEVDDRSLGDKAIDSLKNLIRPMIINPQPGEGGAGGSCSAVGSRG